MSVGGRGAHIPVSIPSPVLSKDQSPANALIPRCSLGELCLGLSLGPEKEEGLSLFVSSLGRNFSNKELPKVVTRIDPRPLQVSLSSNSHHVTL